MRRTFLGFFRQDDIDSLNEKKSVFLFGIPFEREKENKSGSRKAPNALRKQSLEFSGVSAMFNIHNNQTNYYDLGNFHPIKEKKTIKKIWTKAEELESNLLVLGGDHSITWDTLSQAPWNEKTALIWLDAHADLADEYPQGIFHSHGTVFSKLKKELKLKKEQLLFIGGHAYTQTTNEYEKIQKGSEVTFISTDSFFENKTNNLRIITDFCSKFETIYLSIDSDVIDQVYVPTHATCEPFGFTPQIILEMLKTILPKTKYIDFVEVRHTKFNRISLNFGVGLIFKILENWKN